MYAVKLMLLSKMIKWNSNPTENTESSYLGSDFISALFHVFKYTLCSFQNYRESQVCSEIHLSLFRMIVGFD